MNILVIGGGNMGLTYALSISENSLESTKISILEKDDSKIEELMKSTNFDLYQDPSHCVTDATILLLAVKPQVSEIVFENIRPFLNTNQLVISIMAGVTVSTITNGLKIPKIVRAMPNLPAQVKHGVTGYFASSAITENELTTVASILSATGSITKVNTETDIDAITALSGSGPAYVFYFMDAMIKEAENFGFSKEESKNIVLNTFLGTSKLFESSNLDAQSWMDKVTSKGGTTHAAITNFNSHSISENIRQGVKAAFIRAQELGEK